MDHLHARRIKHRDIKPSNILIQGETILLADFGISKAVPNDETTGTVGSVGPHTFNYSAPEVIGEGNARRGRATDIFSLGCIFLEMCTALLAPPGSRAAFATFRLESSATLAYALNQDAILSWILHLWAHWSLLAREKSADDECASSRLKGHLDREQQIPQRTDSGAMQKAAKRAEQDIALGEDFVFIEKRRVEIDALADEIAANPHSARPSSPLTARPSSPLAARLSSPLAARLSSPLTARLSSSLSALPSTWDAMKRRATTQSSPAAQTGATVPSQTIQIQPKRDAVIEDALPDLAFLMLDPNPRKRITARQLVAMMSSPRLHYLGSINKIGCIKCRVPSHKDEDEMLHSEFKNVEDLKLARDPQHALTMKPAEDWEGVKRE
jgi:serine/threonine protein kinase